MDPSIQGQLEEHVKRLRACETCPKMHRPSISGAAVLSSIILIGQAPGIKEPVLGRPFAWTAGKTLFRWFQDYNQVDEATFRASVYMAAVCRCYPGKNPEGGDRVPDVTEISNCATWMAAEFHLLKPTLVLAVGKLAINQFMPCSKLDGVVGGIKKVERFGREFDVIALPHPSGTSTWHRMEPGKTLLKKALACFKDHPAFIGTFHAKR